MKRDEESGTETLSILYGDTKDYSKLSDFEQRVYRDQVLPELQLILNQHHAFGNNTAGDSVFALFRDPEDAARCALAIRDLFLNTNWQRKGLRELSVRLALHLGPVHVGQDAVRGRMGVVGRNVNLAARIEPKTPAGCVYATNAFVQVHKTAHDAAIAHDDMGQIDLAKDWGPEHLYHVRWARQLPLNFRPGTNEPAPGIRPPSSLETPPLRLSEAKKGGAKRHSRKQRPAEQLLFREQLHNTSYGVSWNDLETRCKQNLLVVGWSCRGVNVSTKRDFFIRLASSNRTVQFLVYEPKVLENCSINLGPVCNVGPEYVHHDVNKGLEDVRELIRLANSKARTRIELRVTDWLIAWSAVGVDISAESGMIQVELYLYMNPFHAPNHLDKRIEMLLTPRSRFYEGFRASLDAIWRSAKTVES